MLCSDPANKTKHWFVLQRAHNGPSAGCPELDMNKAQICCSERTYGNGIMLDRPLQFKLHQSYRPLPRYIQEIIPAAKSGYQL